MHDERIYLASPHMSDEGFERQYIEEAFDTNWIAPLGKNVDCFEKAVADYVGVASAAALSSGTAALHLSLKAAGIKAGDRVFCQSLTFVGTANPILYEKAEPIFIDSEKDTWNMDPDCLEEGFRQYPDAKAVIVVHLYGTPAKCDEIREICDRHGVALIEDAAESLGSAYKGRFTGGFGDYGVISFNGNKIITSSGGGMVLSDKSDMIRRIRFWSTQSRNDGIYYDHSEIGYNYRMSNVVAGIGRGQMKVLPERLAQKRKIYAFYKKALGNIEGIGFIPESADYKSNCWLSVATFTRQKPADIISRLNRENIEARPVWKPMHLQPLFKGCKYIGRGVSDEFFKTGLCLPSDTHLTEEQLTRISDIVQDACK